MFGSVGSTISAQSDYTSKSGQDSKERAAQGELVKVDTTHQTLTVKLSDGDEIQFQYNSNTKVEGSEEGVQGLSTETPTRVNVHYEEQSGQKLATRIEVIKSDR